MAEKTIKTRIMHKHDIEENWLKAENFIPLEGEIIIYDIDGNNSSPRIKIGDGENYISNLEFFSSGNEIISTETIDEICGTEVIAEGVEY